MVDPGTFVGIDIEGVFDGAVGVHMLVRRLRIKADDGPLGA